MRYDSYRYLWPPRPEQACPPSMLHHYEQCGWWAQAKLNGDCTTIYVPPDRQSFAKGRHGPDNSGRWQPGDKWHSFARTLPGNGWHVFVGEALHKRGVGITDTIYLFDLLVADGEYLVGIPFGRREFILTDLCGDSDTIPALSFLGGRPSTHTEISAGVWLAHHYALGPPPPRPGAERRPARGNLGASDNGPHRDRPGAFLYETMLEPYVEGLVLKDPAAPLRLCSTPTSNSHWQAKCRRATEHLSF